MKLFIAALGTETNTFSPLPTGWSNFRETLFERRDASATSNHFFVLPLVAWAQAAAEDGDEVYESLSAFAQPAGRTVQSVWEELRDTLLRDLEEIGSPDVVLLHLHGAMASSECDDCEGELIELVRKLVGPRTIIGVELDLHCHLTQRIVKNADAVVLYKEYPHTDIVDRAEELYEICHQAAQSRKMPVMALRDCALIGVWRTTDPPVRALVDWMTDTETTPGVLSISFCHGFPWADVPDVGAKALVVADADEALADRVANQLHDRILRLQKSYRPEIHTIETAMARAAAAKGTLVAADIADNAGGGAPSDSTFLLRALIETGIRDVLLGLIWDPVAVRICQEAGEGAVLDLRIGGKTGLMSGAPLDVSASVIRVVEKADIAFGRGRMPIGAAALIDIGGIKVALNTVRTQMFHPSAFTQLGADPSATRVVIVKSAQHFHAGFAPIADEIIYVAAPGAVSVDFSLFKWSRTSRPLSFQTTEIPSQ